MIEKFSNPRSLENNPHVNLNDENIENVPFAKIRRLPAVSEHLTPKLYLDIANSSIVDESSSLRLDTSEDLKIDEQDSMLPNYTLPPSKTIREKSIKPNVGSLSENNRNTPVNGIQ